MLADFRAYRIIEYLSVSFGRTSPLPPAVEIFPSLAGLFSAADDEDDEDDVDLHAFADNLVASMGRTIRRVK
jgi:hypothetical protein